MVGFRSGKYDRPWITESQYKATTKPFCASISQVQFNSGRNYGSPVVRSTGASSVGLVCTPFSYAKPVHNIAVSRSSGNVLSIVEKDLDRYLFPQPSDILLDFLGWESAAFVERLSLCS